MALPAKEIRAAEGSVRTAVCDVRKKSQMDRTVAQIIRQYRSLDVLMNIAGMAKLIPFVRTDEKLWDTTMDVNLKGGFLFARAVAPQMIKQRSGKLVFMSSTNAWDAEAELAPYNASKAGLYLLAKTRRSNWARSELIPTLSARDSSGRA
jgi:NAD(P)-dependent dehydrogenase (short-subunit alcohol dehydrogenase family)